MLFLLDSSLARVTAFTLDGYFIDAWELPSITRVHQLLELPDGRFILVGQHNEHIIHIVDSNFSVIETSLVSVDDLLTTNNREERVLLHFSLQETGRDGLDFIVEKFSDDGDLEGTSIIDSMDSIEITLLSLDSNGNIYLSDNRDFSRLRRLAILGL